MLQGTYDQHLGDIMLLGKDFQGQPQQVQEELQEQDEQQQARMEDGDGSVPCTVHLKGQTDRVLTFRRVA